ncbi:SET domain-containing protein SmydA-8-like [Thrips palmi]|uniref:SET domain-containing protein SmydA-8-like n=1 Tax=Thrips palmi TaxID=161013 RepID=A0A6P8YSF7_THRPL|nr:SET domain-containing protein SmydA-8-like [Thrips palmi]XP_034242980.1 SET domain-containing protein SmydA-8-like [Thrips palmi]XP_034242988.1 SET domain-containing protein SmydA-8-like [Thrips palmi]XP_034242996.1 SET domain-containing protein SmydA-8-like [Thrips palmi]
MSADHPICHTAATGPCAVCGQPGRPCARCRVHCYCGKEHQKKHWPKHRAGCGSVALRDGVLVAAKDIPAHTVIMREQPSISFPASPLTYNQNQENVMLCVACCADLSEVQPPCQCRHCGLPVCDKACSQASAHQPECQAFQRAKYKVPFEHVLDARGILLGACVATLRVALAYPKNPLLQHLKRDLDFDEKGLKSSPEATRDMLGYQTCIALVIRHLRQRVGISWIPEAELASAALIVCMFAESISGPSPDRWDDVAKQAYYGVLYVGMSLRKHSCFPNTGCKVLRQELNEYVVVTTRAVAAGECITNMHQGCHWIEDTLRRRDIVLVRWGFVCHCERCRDPTELGMYVGSPCCADCAGQSKQSYLVPANAELSRWRCEGCEKEMTAAAVKALTEPASKQLMELHDASPDRLFKFIDAHLYPRGPLHRTHTLVLRASEYIRTDIFHRRADETASAGDLDRWEAMTRGLLRALDRLLPGTCESRVLHLMELRRLVLRRLRVAQENGMLATMMGMFGGPRSQDTGRKIAEYKQAVLEVNKELRRYHFGREEDDPKRSLREDPFGGR